MENYVYVVYEGCMYDGGGVVGVYRDLDTAVKKVNRLINKPLLGFDDCPLSLIKNECERGQWTSSTNRPYHWENDGGSEYVFIQKFNTDYGIAVNHEQV